MSARHAYGKYPLFHGYIVIADLGHHGHVISEQTLPGDDFHAVVREILEGQYERPLRVLHADEALGTLRDVSAAVAKNLISRAEQGDTLTPAVWAFCDDALPLGSIPQSLREAA